MDHSENLPHQTPQGPNTFNVNNNFLNFESLTIDDSNAVDHSDFSRAVGPVQGTLTLQTGIFYKQSQEMTPPTSSFVNLPPSQENPDVDDVDWPPLSINSRKNIRARRNFNNNGGTGNAAFQESVSGTNSAPGTTASQESVFAKNFAPDSTYPSSSRSNSSFYGNQGLCYPFAKQLSSGSNVGLSRPGFQENNCNVAIQGMEAPPAYAQTWENSSLPPGFNVLELTKCSIRSELLREILEQEKYVGEILSQVVPSNFELMSEGEGCRLFDVLLEKCEICDLYAIVEKITSDSESFVALAKNETSSSSIQGLIKRLKNTGLEATVAGELSRFAFSMMTHKTASHVIRQCFRSWDDAYDHDLHDCLIKDFQKLARDPVGCRAINFWIRNTRGVRSSQLLILIARDALPLSRDPSGSFVVQYALNREIEWITRTICINLSGMLVELAQMERGSHVVENCLESSHFGRALVTEAISRDTTALLMLAKDQFGNYVVRKALMLAKMYDPDMFKKLLQQINYSNSRNAGSL